MLLFQNCCFYKCRQSNEAVVFVYEVLRNIKEKYILRMRSQQVLWNAAAEQNRVVKISVLVTLKAVNYPY